jgi:two-component system response regulator FixJ
VFQSPVIETRIDQSTLTPSAKSGSTVYIIDDESDVRRSLHFLLASAGLVSWPFASAQDFLDNFGGLEPAPVLIDIRMPGMDGLELMALMRERGVNWPVIMMSAHGDIKVAVKAIKLGAIEFLEKPFQFEALNLSLQAAFAQLAQANDSFVARNAARVAFALLSPREAAVINVLMRGIPNKTAAHVLDLSVRTVEMHRANALAKLQVKSIAEVIRLANAAELDILTALQYEREYV